KRRFDFYGLRLAGDWSAETERDLFSLWVEKYYTYYSIKSNCLLQQVIETQFVQRTLIESMQNVPNPHSHLGMDFMDWAQATLSSQSQIVVNYIKSLKDKSSCHKFLRIQSKIKPYGLDVKIESGGIHWKIQVIEFWATHVLVFLKMKKPGETDSLRIVVEDLVRMDFQDTSTIMKEFLIKAKSHTFAQEKPVLAQFLKYLSRRSKSQVSRNHARYNFNKFSLQMQANAKLKEIYPQL
ncbi:hypothetical protein DFH28DRAFT_1179670, partial [Melampsora americana]